TLEDYPGYRIDLRARQVGAAQGAIVAAITRLHHFESAKLAHVLQRVQPFGLGGLRQAGHTVENVTIVLVNGDFRARPVRAFKVLPNSQLSPAVDLPAQLDPELVLFPDPARISLVGVLDSLPRAFPGHAQNGLAKGDPRAAVRFVAVEVMPFGPLPHGQ